MSTKRDYNQTNGILFAAKAATGVSEVIQTAPHTNLIIAVSAPLNSTLTFKFQGSIGKDAETDKPLTPDFSATQAVDNMWDYIAAYDTQNPTSIIPGDTGVTLDNTTEAVNTRMFIVNTSAIRFFSMQITSRTDGALTAILLPTTF